MMENKFQKEFEYAEYLLEAARQIPHTLLDSKFKNQNPKGKSLHQKLLELYVEECGKQPVGKVCEALVYGSNLLQKLVRRDKLHCVVLNLYPANEGYSLLLRGRNGVETETIKLPYEESELLEYIDASELPPVLVDLLDKSRVNVFYSGCVIVEVRDFRRSATGNIDPVFVLLRPTPQSMLADINALTNDGRRWSQDDQFQLESQLLLETEETLCLDPSPAVYVVTNRLQYERKKFNTPLLLRNVKKYSQAAVNRKRKFAHGPAPKELTLHDFIHRKKEKLKQPPPVNLKVGKSNVDMWKQRPVNLTVPESVETERFAKALEKPKHSSSDNVPVLIEECSLEREGPQGRCVCYRVSIYRRPSDLFYLGELYMDHDYVEGQKKGTVCRFPLGLQSNAEKYVKQLEEMFTEKGALLAKITRSVPGHPPQVSIPPTVPASTGSAPSQTTAQALMGHAAGLASAITAQVDGGSVSVGGKKLKPLHLSTSSTGNLVSPQSTPTLTSPIGITTTQLTNQMTINIQHPLQPTAGQSHAIGRHRHSSRSMGTPSPVSSSVPAAQLPSYSEAVAGQPGSHKPSSTPTPPPLVKTGSVRRGSVTETFTTTIGAAPDGGVTPPSLGQQAVAPNVNIANIPGLAANINIQNLANLQGMNLTNLQGLGNMQVSLTGVSVPGGGIAVPVPINMINTSSSILQNQGIIVSSLPSQTTGVTASTSNSAINTTSQINAPHVTSPTTYVTMVTAMPAATGTSSSVSSTSSTSTAVSSGVITNPTSVLAGPQQNMLQVPINVTGNLAQFVPHLKTIRGHPGLPLLQLQGQQGIQVLNLQQQQRLQAQLPQSAAGTPAQGTTTSAASNAPPTSGVLTGQSLSGKAGQPTTLTQQLIQLNQPGGFPSQLQIPRPFHFHPMPTQKHSAPPKTKSKKRATPTPPKN